MFWMWTNFSQSSHLVTHQQIHAGEKSFKCNEFEKAFQQHSDLTEHLTEDLRDSIVKRNTMNVVNVRNPSVGTQLSWNTRDCILERKKFECEKACTSGLDLIKQQKIHREEKPYECPECGKTFQGNSDLIQHWIINIGEKLYECSECGKAFSQMSHLVTHQKIHTGEKSYQCKECGKVFH